MRSGNKGRDERYGPKPLKHLSFSRVDKGRSCAINLWKEYVGPLGRSEPQALWRTTQSTNGGHYYTETRVPR